MEKLDHKARLESLEQRFCLALLQASRAWRRVADTAAANFGLSEATAYPLVMMSRLGEGPRQTVLAEAMGVEGPSLVRLLDQLCAAGLVQRREDPSDRRAKTLHLTDKGPSRQRRPVGTASNGRAPGCSISAPPDDLRAGLRIFAVIERAADEVGS